MSKCMVLSCQLVSNHDRFFSRSLNSQVFPCLSGNTGVLSHGIVDEMIGRYIFPKEIHYMSF